MSETIVTGKVRLSFVNVFTPRATQEGQDPKYSVTLLIPKTDADTMNKINAEIQKTLQESVSIFGGQMPANPALPIYDGDGLRPTGERFGEECKGHYVMTASSKQPPQVVDANVQPIISQTDVYSGCYGRASIRFFAYNKAGRKGIGCGLGNVQKLADGDALSGRTTATEDFGTAQSMQQPKGYPMQQPMGYPMQQPKGYPMQQPMGYPMQQYVPQPTTHQSVDPISGAPINVLGI